MSKKHRIDYSNLSKMTEEPVEALQNEEVLEESEEASEIEESKPIYYAVVECRNLLNVRFSPEVGDNVICKIPKGTTVEVLDGAAGLTGDDSWSKISVEHNGVSVEGFVMSTYLNSRNF